MVGIDTRLQDMGAGGRAIEVIRLFFLFPEPPAVFLSRAHKKERLSAKDAHFPISLETLPSTEAALSFLPPQEQQTVFVHHDARSGWGPLSPDQAVSGSRFINTSTTLFLLGKEHCVISRDLGFGVK